MTDQYDGKAVRVVLDAVRTLRTANETHEALLGTVGHATLEIDCEGVQEADLTFIQSLLALRASALEGHRSVTLAHPAAGALKEALERGGFLSADASDRAFWTLEETA